MMPELDAVMREVERDIDSLLPTLAGARKTAVVRVASLSDYFRKNIVKDPHLVSGLFDSGDMEAAYGDDTYRERLATLTLDVLDAGLRRTRVREMCRIIYRDLMRIADLEEITRDLSNLADASIETALALHYAHNAEIWGIPTGEASGAAQQMAVLALGKLGAQELNLSSDIDLVFLYDERGQVRGKREMSNQEFFVRTSRAIISSLDAVRDGGFVFRVDMRLRPYGDSGALILNRAAMEKYFVEQGRDWERYAFIKARACAGNIALGEGFLAWLTPFVFRKHLDYGAIESLREMKRLINYEVGLKELYDDLKLGHGGIREIEFIAQAHQIVWGGARPEFRMRKLLQALSALGEEGMLPNADAERLQAAYRFLRNSEHALQAEYDQQTQRLPQGELSEQRLACAMGYDSYRDYREALDVHRQVVMDCFSTFISYNQAEKEELLEGNLYWVKIWRQPTADHAIQFLAESGFAPADVIAARLAEFESHLASSEVQEIGTARIDQLMPVVLSLAAREETPGKALERLLRIIDSIARRSTYVAFLLENLDALKRTVQLCAMSPWVSEQLEKFPILLYDLTDRVTEETVFERSKLEGELRQLFSNIDPADLETQMDSLRQFKNSAMLKVAVFELLDLLPVMKASDALTDIAEIILQRAFELAWNYLMDRHGEPCNLQHETEDRSFAMVAYGKLGGIELGYGSDLDLVFLHDADIHGSTDGDKSVSNVVFYSRLAQRLIHILTSYTRFGVLYEVDLRLRPAGNKGPLVTTMSAYERYLTKDAWTWEHQALVRARYVAGDAELGARFGRIRLAQLSRRRDREALLADVVSMREKMRRHLEQGESRQHQREQEEEISDQVLLSGFDLKHGAGAIVDIEFMVQYAVLALSCEHPILARWTDKMRILDELKPLGFFERDEVIVLQDAYLSYRSAVHYQWLGGEVSSFERLNRFRADVVAIWNRCMSAPASD